MQNNKIIDISNKPEGPSKLFFGDYGSYIRTDQASHVQAKRLKEYSEGNVWFSKEIDFTNDRFEDLDDIAQRIFGLNISYQTLADSGVTNAYESVITQLITDPAWYLVFKRIGTEEAIHAESYSYALNEMLGTEEATKILDLVYQDDFIKKRMNNEVNDFSDVLELCQGMREGTDDMKKAILRMFLRTYFLESIKFPFSFFTTFQINSAYNSAIQGSTRLIKLIAHDELTFHVPTGHNVLKILKNEEHQGFSHLFINGWFEREAVDMMIETVEADFKWSDYLLDKGEFAGFNKKINDHFLRYQGQTRLNTLGIDGIIYDDARSDIIKTFNTQKDLNMQNTAMQEAENSAYQKGVLKNDFKSGVWTPSKSTLFKSEDNL